MTNCQLLQHPAGSERCVVHCSVGSSWCPTVCFTTTNSNGGFENGKPRISESDQIPDVMLRNSRANRRGEESCPHPPSKPVVDEVVDT